MLDHFWNRWRKEYVSYLRETQRLTPERNSEAVNVNDIVLVYDEKVPRHLWRIGRIIKLLESNDNKVRGAEVRLGKTKAVIRRPVNKLYPLVSSTDKQIDRTPFTLESKRKIATSKNEIPRITVNPEVHNTGDMLNSKENVVDNDSTNVEVQGRPRRKAAIFGEIKRKSNCS